MKNYAIFVVLALAVGGWLLAKKVWETDTPYQQWDRKDALQLLNDSPWAQDQTISESGFSSASTTMPTGPGLSDGPNRTDPSAIDRQLAVRRYYVRFQSAAPVRMALAALALLSGRVSEEDAQQYVQQQPFEGKIVVAVSVPPGQDRTELDQLTTEFLKNETYLLLKKSKKRIPLERFLTPVEAGGNEAFFIFPRQEGGKPLVRVEEGEVRFITQLNPRTKINRKFNLKKMVYLGKLEI